MPRRSPLEQARQWWKERIDAERYVVPSVEAPAVPVARVLRDEGLIIEVAGRRAWILLSGGGTDARAAFLANYWAVLGLVLMRYAPAAVAGAAAVRLHLENFSPPEELPAYHGANQSEYALPLYPGFRLRLRPRTLSASSTIVLSAPGHAQIPVQAPADILTTLDETEVAKGIEPISAWLRHLVLRTPELDAAVAHNPRPVILQRLADLASQLHNEPLARQLERFVRRVAHRKTSPSRTGVGTRIAVPHGLRQAPRGSGSPWLDEQTIRLTRQESEFEQIAGKELEQLARFSWPLLRGNAEQNKAYDAYHNTTMEGYRISPEAADAIVRGEPPPEQPRDPTMLEAAIAVQGYTIAYAEVLERARKADPIDTNLILDLHEALLRPAVDAGITDSAALRGWRSSSVGLRGWRYVPPNPKKIPDLIGGLERFAARSFHHPVVRALLVHLEFVTIHPFLDGNGRIGRLLMNHALLDAGLPWVTIRSDERVPFFRAIERAQVEGDTRPYIQFLWHLVKHAVHDLESRPRRRRSSTPRLPREDEN